jgi:exonuclease V gamma subunit
VHSLVLQGATEVRAPLASAAARAALARLVALQQRSRAQALPLMPQSAWCYVEALAKGKDADAAFALAARCWNEHDYSEGRDPWVRLALRGRDPFAPGNDAQAATFRELATELFTLLYGSGGGHDAAA